MRPKLLLAAIFFMFTGQLLFAQAPTITSFSPAQGGVGTLITVAGTNLANPTAFSVGGKAALVISSTGAQLVGYVMPGATSGLVSVTTSGGSVNSSTNFTVTPPATTVMIPQTASLEGLGFLWNNEVESTGQGNSVSISADGNTAVVGASNSPIGEAFVWARTGAYGSSPMWTQQGVPLNVAAQGNELTGYVLASVNVTNTEGQTAAISADGNTVILGAPGNDVTATDYQTGSFWCFTRSGANWTQQGSFVYGTGGVGSPQEGASVALSADGNTAIVGGPYDRPGASLTGATWVFVRTNGVWAQQGAKLVGTGAVGECLQGWSVAVSADGNTAVVGGLVDNGTIGAAWIFTRSGTTWTQQGNKLVGSDAAGEAEQGSSVAISADGNTVIVGGRFDNNNVGAGWIYTRNNGVWSQQGPKLVATNTQANQGTSVALSADGNIALVGGAAYSNNNGGVWEFTRNAGSWSLLGQPSNNLNTNLRSLGSALAISADGTTGFAGAGGGGGNGTTGGAVVFTAQAPTVVTQPATAITGAAATLNGTVDANGPAATVTFQYSTSSNLSNPITATLTTGASPIPAGTGVTAFVSALTGLAPATTYYFAISSTNVYGATQGGILSFTTLTVPPAITPGVVTGNILSCAGTPSVSPYLQQFAVSAVGLTTPLVVTAPTGFEVSNSASSGYAASINITPTVEAVNTIVYVRSAAAAAPGAISGNVVLTSTGATTQNIAVTGILNTLPTASAVPAQTFTNAVASTAINFAGTANSFSWTNDTPGIGLAASGDGDIASFTPVNTGSSPITAHITVTPVTAGFAYVPNLGGASVSAINVNTYTVAATIPVGEEPYGVAVSPDGSRAYITNTYSSSVSVISTATNTVTSTISLTSEPQCIALSPDGKTAYITMANNTVSVVNTATNTVITSIPVGSYAYGLAVSPDGSRVYVANLGSNTVSIINTATNTVVASPVAGTGPIAVSVSPDGSRAYVSNYQSANVSVINAATNTVVSTITTGTTPCGSVVNAAGTLLYVANYGSNNVSVISLPAGTISATVPTGLSPLGVSLSSDGSSLFVTNAHGGSVSVINTATNTVSATVPVGSAPNSLGNFVTANGCSGAPVTFTITVNPTVPPVITAGEVTGSISACVGTASASPLVQQFTASASGLTANITATAPAGFEVSLSAGSGYSSTVTLTPTGGVVNNTVIYVRSAASDGPGNITGNVVLASTGATSQNEAVAGVVNALPTVNPVSNQTVVNGSSTAAISFTGTANTFLWSNDTPGIGLVASSDGNITSFTAVNNGNSPVTAKVTVTPATAGFAYIADGNYQNGPNSLVSVLNTITNKVVTTIPVGLEPFGVSVSADGSRVYTANQYSNNVSVINAQTNSLIATIPFGSSVPYGIVVSPDGTKAYAAVENQHNVSVINTATNTIVSTIPLGGAPFGIAVSPDGSRIYVPSASAGGINPDIVSVINTQTNTVIATVPVGHQAVGIAVSPDGSKVYVANGNSNTVSVISTATNTVTATIATSPTPYAIVVSPDGSMLYVSNYTANTVSVFNTTTNALVTNIPVGNTARGVSISPDGSRLYVANQVDNTVSIINTATNTVIATVPAGGNPVSLGNFVTGGQSCYGQPITFSITVNPTVVVQPQTITFPPIAPVNYGYLRQDPGATSTNTTIPITYTSSNPAVAIITNGQIQLVGVGTTIITASQAGNATYAAATPVSQDFTVNPLQLTITADDKSKPLNSANPALTITFGSFANGDTPQSLTTQPTISTTATISSGVGTYPITVSGAVDPNYTFVYVAGTLTVTPIAPTSTTQAATLLTSTGATLNGVVNDDGAATTVQFQLGTDPTLGTSVTEVVTTGNNPILPGTGNSSFTSVLTGLTPATTYYFRIYGINNYGTTYGNILSFTTAATPPPVVITFTSPGTVVYGSLTTPIISSTDPTSPIMYRFVTPGVAQLTGGNQFQAIGVGSTSIVAYQYAPGTTNIEAVADGSITVIPAPLTITPNNLTVPFGQPIPTLTATYTGFVNGETTANFSQQAVLYTNAQQGYGAGNYNIFVNQVPVDPNYSFTLVDGTLTITPAFPVPSAATVTQTNVTATGATLNGTANGNGADATVIIQYTTDDGDGLENLITATLTTGPNPLPGGAGTTNYSAVLTGLQPNTTYYYVIKASNTEFSTTGNVLRFTTPAAALVETITFPPPAPVTYGSADVAPGATSTNKTIPITYTSSNTAVATIVNGNIHIVGAGTTQITASQAGNATYSPATPVIQTFTVNPAPLTITADNQSTVYRAGNPPLIVEYLGFVNNDSQASLTTLPTATTTATVTSIAGTYPITVSGAVDPNYTITYVAGTLTVSAASPAAVTQAATSVSSTGATLNGTVSDGGAPTTVQFLFGTDSHLTGASTLAVTTGTSPIPAGTGTAAFTGVVADLSPGTTYYYEITGANSAGGIGGGILSFTTATIPVAVITFSAPTSAVYGSADLTPNGTSNNSGTPVTYTSSNTAVATITGAGNIHIVSAGTTQITASQAAANGYTAANPVILTFTVTPAPLTVTAHNETKVYGSANPFLAYQYKGFVNGDDSTRLSPQATVSTTATSSSGVGTYPITLSGALDPDYSITYVDATLTITPAALTITANNQTKVQGTANPALTAVYTGFVNNNTADDLSSQPVLATTATTSSEAGTYAITVSGAADPNYTITYVPGRLTITPPLVFNQIAAKTYGDPDFNPGATGANVTYSSGNTTVATITNGGDVHIVGAGSVTITASSGGSSLSQTVVINPAPLTITANDQSRTYGADNPALTLTYTGFVYSDDAASLTTAPAVATTAAASSDVGTYPITASGAADPNYTITYAAGKLSVTQAALTITANDQTKAQGAANPLLTVTYAGFVNNNTADDLSTLPDVETTALTSSDPGTYPITVSGAVDPNYTITYVSGTLTILPPPTLVANNVLTPNGDGVNDVWIVHDIQFYPDNNVTIYDRAGRQVYSAHGYNNDWGGTVNGKPLQEGTYYYVLVLKPDLPYIRGFISIIRSK